MSDNPLDSSFSAGDDILAVHIKQLITALNGALVGRSNDAATGGQSLGTADVPWGDAHLTRLIIGGSHIDFSTLGGGIPLWAVGKSFSSGTIVSNGSAIFTVGTTGTTAQTIEQDLAGGLNLRPITPYIVSAKSVATGYPRRMGAIYFSTLEDLFLLDNGTVLTEIPGGIVEADVDARVNALVKAYARDSNILINTGDIANTAITKGKLNASLQAAIDKADSSANQDLSNVEALTSAQSTILANRIQVMRRNLSNLPTSYTNTLSSSQKSTTTLLLGINVHTRGPNDPTVSRLDGDIYTKEDASGDWVSFWRLRNGTWQMLFARDEVAALTASQLVTLFQGLTDEQEETIRNEINAAIAGSTGGFSLTQGTDNPNSVVTALTTINTVVAANQASQFFVLGQGVNPASLNFVSTNIQSADSDDVSPIQFLQDGEPAPGFITLFGSTIATWVTGDESDTATSSDFHSGFTLVKNPGESSETRYSYTFSSVPANPSSVRMTATGFVNKRYGQFTVSGGPSFVAGDSVSIELPSGETRKYSILTQTVEILPAPLLSAYRRNFATGKFRSLSLRRTADWEVVIDAEKETAVENRLDVLEENERVNEKTNRNRRWLPSEFGKDDNADIFIGLGRVDNESFFVFDSRDVSQIRDIDIFRVDGSSGFFHDSTVANGRLIKLRIEANGHPENVVVGLLPGPMNSTMLGIVVFEHLGSAVYALTRTFDSPFVRRQLILTSLSDDFIVALLDQTTVDGTVRNKMVMLYRPSNAGNNVINGITMDINASAVSPLTNLQVTAPGNIIKASDLPANLDVISSADYAQAINAVRLTMRLVSTVDGVTYSHEILRAYRWNSLTSMYERAVTIEGVVFDAGVNPYIPDIIHSAIADGAISLAEYDDQFESHLISENSATTSVAYQYGPGTTALNDKLQELIKNLQEQITALTPPPIEQIYVMGSNFATGTTFSPGLGKFQLLNLSADLRGRLIGRTVSATGVLGTAHPNAFGPKQIIEVTALISSTLSAIFRFSVRAWRDDTVGIDIDTNTTVWDSAGLTSRCSRVNSNAGGILSIARRLADHDMAAGVSRTDVQLTDLKVNVL